jgi:glycosyltransferase involved in cell wall biosynthesis
MKVIISTGQGRLHLVESAKSLLAKHIDIILITGWIPSSFIPDKLIDLMGGVLGRKKLSVGLNKRKIFDLEAYKIKTCGVSEFYVHFLFLLSKYTTINRDRAAVKGWILFGKMSSKYIKDVDVFHVRSGAGQGGAIDTAKKKGIKVLVDHSIAHPNEVYKQLLKANNGIDGVDIDIRPDSLFWGLVLKDCFEADALLVNSHYVKESFVNNGYEAKKIFVAELGVRKDFIGIKYNWEINGKIKLLFTGGFGKRKGGSLIVEVAKMLVDSRIDFELHIIGSIIGDIIIPEWFEKKPNVFLHGFIPQDELKDYLINSDIYIFPSYSEGAAQSVKEAMAAGLPVITTYQSGAPVVNGVNGILIPDNSSKQLFDSILLLRNDLEKRKWIGTNAIETISSNHNWDNYAEKVIEVYHNVLKG